VQNVCVNEHVVVCQAPPYQADVVRTVYQALEEADKLRLRRGDLLYTIYSIYYLSLCLAGVNNWIALKSGGCWKPRLPRLLVIQTEFLCTNCIWQCCKTSIHSHLTPPP